MALLGNLIKVGIDLNQKIFPDNSYPFKEQNDQLQWLLETAKDTAFGKYYNFEGILQSDNIVEEYKKRVPICDYNGINQQWWTQQQKYPDITWPGKPNFFALSSGTTGKTSKRIPVTEDFLQSMKKVGTSLVKELPNFDFPAELFECEILMLSSSANLSKHENGHNEGEISGINVSNFPGWYDLFYRPGKDIASIDNWDERVEAIAKEAPNWNIGAIAGIPSWVLLMLKKVIEVNSVNNIHEVWPNLSVYASGGVAFETYRKDFEEISGKPITILDTYLASEGFFSYSTSPDSMAMRLATNHGYYYEFIPFDERGVDEQGQILENPVSCSLEEVELEQDYVLVISTCAGAWRYIIGDTIKFTSLDPHEILITGRTKFFLNVVGSQLSEEKLDDAILAVSKDMDITVNEYSVAAIKNENNEYIHQWIIVTESENTDKELLTDKLDTTLKDVNKNYGVARSKALKGIRTIVIDKETYYGFLEQSKKKGGQVKTPKVMKEEKMNSFLDYLKNR